MSRVEIERAIQPIIRNCLWHFGDFKRDDPSEAAFDRGTQGIFRPDVRRVSLLISMALSILGNSACGQGLEIGSGYGYLLLPMALFLPSVRWTAVEHPDRTYVNLEEYERTLGQSKCQIVKANITHERLPFPDGQFSLVTFSEVMEHLPPERLYFVLSEIGRVIRPGGILLASSPNQASLENRLKLLKGKSILDLPDEPECAPGVFPHIRLYTPSEMQLTMAKFGFAVEQCVIESNNSAFRGSSPKSWKRRIRRMYEYVEGRLEFLRCMGDTWHMAFRRAPRE
jgi:SAM-dependent methyltransferase